MVLCPPCIVGEFTLPFPQQMKNPCIYSYRDEFDRVTTLFRAYLAACAFSGFAPAAQTRSQDLLRLKSPGDVTVAPVVPTAIFNTPLAE